MPRIAKSIAAAIIAALASWALAEVPAAFTQTPAQEKIFRAHTPMFQPQLPAK